MRRNSPSPFRGGSVPFPRLQIAQRQLRSGNRLATPSSRARAHQALQRCGAGCLLPRNAHRGPWFARRCCLTRGIRLRNLRKGNPRPSRGRNHKKKNHGTTIEECDGDSPRGRHRSFVRLEVRQGYGSGIYITVTGSTGQQFSGMPPSPFIASALLAMDLRRHYLAAAAAELVEHSEKG